MINEGVFVKRKTIHGLAALAGVTVALSAAVLAPGVAGAAEPSFATCANLSGWYANADEQDRMPTATTAGLRFEGNDLIHHATTVAVEALAHGTFHATVTPDQPSFFSVEVWDGTATAPAAGTYATLRWDVTTSKWVMVTGGQVYTNADPAALVDMPAIHKGHTVRSFGVGYTANPPGTVTTVGDSVTFAGHTCPRPRQAGRSGGASGSASASAPASRSTSASPSSAAPTLPLTGSSPWPYVATAGGLLAAGAVLVLVARRRRTRFEA